MTAPSACFASLPVSKEIVRDPIRTSRFWRFTLCISVGLLADAESADQFRVAFRVFALEVIEEASALADQLQKAAARVMILRVRLEVLCEVVDALAEERHLNFWGPGVAIVCL